jgi:hypothetical protein
MEEWTRILENFLILYYVSAVLTFHWPQISSVTTDNWKGVVIHWQLNRTVEEACIYEAEPVAEALCLW